MESEIFFQKVVRQFGLGELMVRPERVSGGFMHKMYKMETSAGVYALKLLNPVIMERPDAIGNYLRAEKLERILQENDIPVIPALEKDGLKMQCLDGRYYYLFDWFEGKALDWHEIGEVHCRVAGKLLAKIHGIPCVEGGRFSGQGIREIVEQEDKGTAGKEVREISGQEDKGTAGQGIREILGQEDKGTAGQKVREILGQEAKEPTGQDIREILNGEGAEALGQEGMFGEDWDSYIKQAAGACPEIAGELAESRELLYQAQRAYHAAIKSVPNVRCICDGDMDCKNVLWKDNEPYIIDLECLDYGNPFTEMYQLALSWAGGAVCDLDFARFGGFIEEYGWEYGDLPVDWKALSGMGYSWLDWLAYNVRRSLGIECADEEERRMGVRETRETIRRIRHYASVREELVEWLGKSNFDIKPKTNIHNNEVNPNP